MRKLVVHEVIRHTLNNRPGEQIVYAGRRFTYREFYGRVLRLADSLRGLGIGRGVPVAVLDVNSHRYLELHYALSMLGAIIHTVNFRLPGEQILYTMKHAGDAWVFVYEAFAPALAPAAKLFTRWVYMADTDQLPPPDIPDPLRYEDLISAGREEEPPEAGQVEETDAYSIFHTTGTTGQPKGVCYRHRDMVLAAIQIAHHLALHETGARIESRDVFMPLIPFFHIHGWGSAIYVPYLGCSFVLPGRATPAQQVALIKQERVTWLNMVPTQLHMLLDVENFGNVKVLTGGSALPSGLARRAAARGIRFSLIYGGSDQLICSMSVVPEDTDPAAPEALEWLRTGTRPVPMVEVEVRDGGGRPLPRDGRTIGEVWVRSPWLPEGYYRDPERSRESYVGGWFRTGDLGTIFPNGLLYVVDRLKDAVKSGGEWIPTTVLEAILSEHPAVAMAAVLAAPDERWGERPVACVKRKPEAASTTEADLRSFLEQQVEAGRMASYWVPDRFIFVDEIPVTSAGKINKAALRQQVGVGA